MTRITVDTENPKQAYNIFLKRLLDHYLGGSQTVLEDYHFNEDLDYLAVKAFVKESTDGTLASWDTY